MNAAYATFQPALKEEQEKRAGTFTEQHQAQENKDNVISQAILSDLKQAKEEAVRHDSGRFAWGIRQWFAGEGRTTPDPAPEQPSPSPTQRPDLPDVKR